MSPVNTPDYFWAHFPNWVWPFLIAGVLGFFIVQAVHGLASAIKASEGVSKLFGGLGRRLYNHSGRRVLERLDQTADRLECAAAYIVDDTEWHTEADVIMAEECLGLRRKLPTRIPFTEFQRRWREG